MKEIYTEEYTVKERDIDELNHVNNIRYVEWIQEISKAHWSAITHDTIFAEKYLWVVSSHYIEYKSQALLNDILEISTYVEKLEGVLSHRVVEIKNKATGKLLMKSLTKWCMMYRQNKRIARIPQELSDLFKLA